MNGNERLEYMLNVRKYYLLYERFLVFAVALLIVAILCVSLIVPPLGIFIGGTFLLLCLVCVALSIYYDFKAI